MERVVSPDAGHLVTAGAVREVRLWWGSVDAVHPTGSLESLLRFCRCWCPDPSRTANLAAPDSHRITDVSTGVKMFACTHGNQVAGGEAATFCHLQLTGGPPPAHGAGWAVAARAGSQEGGGVGSRQTLPRTVREASGKRRYFSAMSKARKCLRLE